MFTFLDPDILWMMLLPSLFLLYLIGTNTDDVSHVFSPEMMERLRSGKNAMSRTMRNVLFFTALLCMIIALARPVMEKGAIEVQSKGYDVVVALDMSASMLAKDVYPSRMEVALNKAKEIVRLNQGGRIGVVAFSKNAFVVSPLTEDSETVLYLLENINLESIKIGSTKLRSALGAANLLLSDSKQKALVLISDGGNDADFENEIAFAKEEGVSIYILGVGTEEGAPIEKAGGFIKDADGNIVIVKLNEKIKELAKESGGAYTQFSFSSADAEAIWKDIESRLKKEQYGSRQIQDYDELFYYPLGAAVFLMLFAFSSFPKRRSPPFAILLLPLLCSLHTYAGLLDFIELDKAQKAYEHQRYDEAARHYEKLSTENTGNEVMFNLGDSYYKQGKYQEAYNAYTEIVTDDSELEAKKLYNMGNAQMMQGQYQEAEKLYERSLKLHEDSDARHNLELAKKMQQDNQKNQDQQQQKGNQDQQQQQSDQGEEQNQNQSAQNQGNEQNNQQKGQQQEGDDKAKEQERDTEAQKDSRAGGNQENGERKEAGEDTEGLSEREAQKWLQMLQDQKTPTKIYQLPDLEDKGIREEKFAW